MPEALCVCVVPANGGGGDGGGSGGASVAVGGYGEDVVLRSLVTGASRAVLSGHSGWVTSAAHAFDAHGTSWLLTGSADCRCVCSRYYYHRPDDSTPSTHASSCSAILWDLKTLRARRTLTGHSGAIRACDLTADAATAVTGSWDGTAKIWRAYDGSLRHTLSDHEAYITVAKFVDRAAPLELLLLATASTDCTLRVYTVRDGACVARVDANTHWVPCIGVPAPEDAPFKLPPLNLGAIDAMEDLPPAEEEDVATPAEEGDGDAPPVFAPPPAGSSTEIVARMMARLLEGGTTVREWDRAPSTLPAAPGPAAEAVEAGAADSALATRHALAYSLGMTLPEMEIAERRASMIRKPLPKAYISPRENSCTRTASRRRRPCATRRR